jgi:hypothetical protein
MFVLLYFLHARFGLFNQLIHFFSKKIIYSKISHKKDNKKGQISVAERKGAGGAICGPEPFILTG